MLEPITKHRESETVVVKELRRKHIHLDLVRLWDTNRIRDVRVSWWWRFKSRSSYHITTEKIAITNRLSQ